MIEKVEISVAKDFSRFPAGRFRGDGQFSGEAFRDKILLPALNKAQKVIVELDGTAGYGSSFLEEAFGGLVRAGAGTKESIKSRLVIKTIDETLKSEILEYISSAESEE